MKMNPRKRSVTAAALWLMGFVVSTHTVVSIATTSSPPEQIHLAYGATTAEMVVMWSSETRASASPNASLSSGGGVRYGLSPQKLSQSVGEVWQFTEGNKDGIQWLYRARMSNLSPGQSYTYQVFNDFNISSDVFEFTTPKLLAEAYPLQVVMFGDMGKTHGSPTMPHLITEARNGENVALIHVGDFAYDLHTDGGVRGDTFMQRIQDAAAYIPYMTCPGNHEIPYHFSHYRNRFTMPTGKATPDTDMLWWSMDVGPVHFVSYDTEILFVRRDLVQAQMDFLTADLEHANQPEQRKKVPWIVAFGHRPMYCSNLDLDDCTTLKSVVRASLEALFYEKGVDFIVEGHEHSYERLWPVFNGSVPQENYINPRAPIHFISGQAGCNENFGVCVDWTFGPRGAWSAFRSWLPGLYGYGKLKVMNDTHAEWTQIFDVTNRSADTVMIIQENHGPFRGPTTRL
eukprot:scpid49464/ scgid4203/ Iron/zinc purple acid phosphatase-like protein